MKYPSRRHPVTMVEEAEPLTRTDPVALVDRVAAGLPAAEFDALRSLLGLTVEDLAARIGVSVATLSRRRAQNKPLQRDHSDRLVRYARLYWLAVGLFEGDAPAARDWLLRPAISLGGSTPLDFAATEVGARGVENLIGRLEHGVYS